jgi:hypothetical protein
MPPWQLTPCQEEICQCGKLIDLETVVGHAPQPGLLKAELLLYHPEGMLHPCPDMSLGNLHQILQPVFRRIRKGPTLAGRAH